MQLDIIILICIFGGLLLPVPVLGGYCLFFTHKAITSVMKSFNRIDVVESKSYFDPHGLFVVLIYKVVGIGLIFAYILPILILIIFNI